MSLGMSRGQAPVPPDKGSFPLDRKGQCKDAAQAFLECIREHNKQHGKCRSLSKEYLACRMQRGLMKQESFDVLGYQQVEDFEYTQAQKNDYDKGKRGAGYLAGLGVNDIGIRFREQQAKAEQAEQAQKAQSKATADDQRTP